MIQMKQRVRIMMTALKKEKNNNIFCILNWGMAVSCSRNMNFVKCRVSEMSEEIFSMFDNFLHILCIYALGPFLLIRLS